MVDVNVRQHFEFVCIEGRKPNENFQRPCRPFVCGCCRLRRWRWWGGGSNELFIGAVTPSTVNATFSNLSDTNGGARRDVALTASYSGTASGTIFVVVEDPDAVFLGASVDIASGSTATLHLVVSDSAAVGRHIRPIVLHVCRNAACTSEYESFPRTIQKDVTIQGTTTNTSVLSFTSTAGVGGTSQTITVTPPAGLDFALDFRGVPYVTYTAPDGSIGWAATDVDKIFSITKTSTGFDVQAKGAWAGHYVGRMYITTPGYATVGVNLDYQVSAATTPVVTQLTGSISGSGQAGSTADIPVYVDFLRNMGTVSDAFIQTNATGGSPDPLNTFWLRFYDASFFTYGAGPTNNAMRLRFYLNPCSLGSSCLPAGTYTANIVYTGSAFGQTSTFTVPVTFTINP